MAPDRREMENPNALTVKREAEERLGAGDVETEVPHVALARLRAHQCSTGAEAVDADQGGLDCRSPLMGVAARWR